MSDAAAVALPGERGKRRADYGAEKLDDCDAD